MKALDRINTIVILIVFISLGGCVQLTNNKEKSTNEIIREEIIIFKKLVRSNDTRGIISEYIEGYIEVRGDLDNDPSLKTNNKEKIEDYIKQRLEENEVIGGAILKSKFAISTGDISYNIDDSFFVWHGFEFYFNKENKKLSIIRIYLE